MLRGSRDVAHVDAYEQFLAGVFAKRKAGRQARLTEELAVMRPVVVDPVPTAREVRARVSTGGLVRLLGHTYSVPSGLVGTLVTAWIG